MELLDASFEILNEKGVTSNIKQAYATYYGKSKSTTFIDNILEDITNKRQYELYEHTNLAFVVPERVYFSLTGALEHINNVVKFGSDIEGFKPSILIRRTYTPNMSRYIVSGSVLDWIELFTNVDYYWLNSDGSLNPLIFCLKESSDGIVDFTHLILPEQDIKEDYLHTHHITCFTELTEAERLVHEKITVSLTISRAVANEFRKMRDVVVLSENLYREMGSEEVVNLQHIKPEMVSVDSNGYHSVVRSIDSTEKEFTFQNTMCKVPSIVARDCLTDLVKVDTLVTAQLGIWRLIIEKYMCSYSQGTHPSLMYILQALSQDFKDIYQFAFNNLHPNH